MLRYHFLHFSLCPLVLSLDSTEKGLALSSHQVFMCTYKIPLTLPSVGLWCINHSSQLCVLCKLGKGTLMNAENLSGFYRVFGA